MPKHRDPRRKGWVAVVVRAAIATTLALIAPATALAAEVRSGDTVTITPNEVVGDDLYVFGNNLVLEGMVRGDVIAAGSSVTIAGHVTGSVMAAGSTLVVSGPVDGSVRVAGNQVMVSAPIGSDALIAGSNVTVNAPARIGRDMLAAGNAISLLAPVGRDVSVSANSLTVDSTVGGAVNATVTDLVLGSRALVQGPISYISNHDATVAAGARLPAAMQRTPPAVRAANPWEVAGIDTLALIRGFIGMAALGIVLVLAFPRATTTTVATVQQQWAASLGLGFAFLVAMPVLSVVVFGLGLVIGGWWIGLVLLSLYATLAVVGYLTSAEWVGLTALRLSKAQAHPIWALLLGLLTLGLATIVPVLGPLAGLAAIVFGIGSLVLSGWQSYRGAPVAEKIAPNGRVVAPRQPVAV